jgi:hypothetical protein
MMLKKLTIFLPLVFFAFAAYAFAQDSEDSKVIDNEEETHAITASNSLFSCSTTVNGQALLGWCANGTFYGLMHFGWGVYAKTDGDVRGVGQMVVGYAETGGDFKGVFQTALVGVNTVKGDYKGLFQLNIAGTQNVQGDLIGFGQISIVGYNHVAGDYSGFTQVGLLSKQKVEGTFRGFSQVSPYNEVNGDFRGVYQGYSLLFFPLPSIYNSVDSNFSGLCQLGIYNRIGQVMKGSQFGIVNEVDKGYGLQFGFVNIAKRFYGIQIGLWNVAYGNPIKRMILINVGF